MSFINQERLKNYPRIIAIVIWVIFFINTIFRQGWVGRIGSHISFDFRHFMQLEEFIGQILISSMMC